MIPMHLFENMACAFLRTFGITQPDDQTRRRAAWFILALLVVAFCGVSGGRRCLPLDALLIAPKRLIAARSQAYSSTQALPTLRARSLRTRPVSGPDVTLWGKHQ